MYDRLKKAIKQFVYKIKLTDTKSQFMSKNPEYMKYNIGEWTYGYPSIESWDDSTALQIGKYCSIARGVTFLLGGEHRPDWVSTYPFSQLWDGIPKIVGHPKTKGSITIGNDVWIGTDALVLSGVTVGNGAVIGARSVITKDVAPYSIVAGSPARLIRYRFSAGQIEQLEQIAWWDWPENAICESLGKLLSNDIDGFINACKSCPA